MIENVITANRDLNGIHFDGGEMALGGIQALRAAGITDDDMKAGRPYLTGMDGYNGWLGTINQGIGQITDAPSAAGPWLGFDTVARQVADGRGTAETRPPSRPIMAEVTPENASAFYAADQPDDFWSL